MTETIQIHSYPSKNEDDIQEYHEIIEETQFSNNITSSQKCENDADHPNSYDFFTGTNVKTSNKSVKKSKKPKKKGKTGNLMDVINCEMADVVPPITENIITRLDYSPKQRASILKNNTILGVFKRRSLSGLELGQKLQVINLSPIFPTVLETAIRENNEIPVEYVEPVVYNNLIKIYKDTPCINDVTTFLDVTLKNLKFNHHHKFSLENLLSTKLGELFYEYENINKILKDCSRDIKVNRETKKNLKEDLIKINPNKENSIRFDPIIRKYTGKLLQLKELYMDTLKSKKEIIHKIQSLWSDIEMIRIKTKCTLTSCHLHINERQYGEDELDKEWNDLFNLEFMDALDKIEYDYVTRYIEYKEAKQEQKLENSTKRNILKPKLIVDEETLNEKIEQIVHDIVSYNRIELVLSVDKSILSDNSKSKTSTCETIYYFEIYIDDIFVCESEKHNTDNGKFEVDFNEMFSIQILPSNNNMTIALIENHETVSHVLIDLIEMRKRNNYSDFTKEKFSYSTTIKPTSKFVGSGNTIKEIAAANKVRLKCCGMFQSPLYTTGEIDVRMKWNKKSNENYMEEIKCTVEMGRKIKRLLHGIDKPNLDTLKDLIKDLFGKDVTKDDVMLTTLMDLCKSELKIDYAFPIDVNSPEFVRFKLIHVRNNGGFTSLVNSMIPLNPNQISTELLNCLQKTDVKDLDIDYLTENEIDMDPIGLQRFITAKYIEKLNKNMLKKLDIVLMKKTYKDIVREVTLRSLLTSPKKCTLGCLSNVTKQQILKESLDKPHEIKITVLRAFNLLDRSADMLEDAENDYRIAGYKMHPLRPFVRVSYSGIAVQTVTAIGCHPSWNHTLKINTKLAPLSSLHTNIYDEYKANITEKDSDDEHSNKTVQYKYYNKWLGTIEIPMYNVLALGSLRGTFKISTPPMTIGYENSQMNMSTSIIPEINQLLKKGTSFIALHITTDLSHLGRLYHYNQPTNPSDDDLIKHLNDFTTQYSNDFPFRSISLTFIDSDGNNKCITEFLQSIPPPNQAFFPKNTKNCESAGSKSSGFSKSGERKDVDIERGERIEDIYSVYNAREDGESISKMIHTCMRYVALIPSYEITESHAITLKGLELLKIVHGSQLDHTILLASYFLYLDIKCWVVIGLGLPRGPSSYLLIKYDLGTNKIVQIHDQHGKGFFHRNDGCLWYVFDSISGEKFELREVGCPLKTVDYVFDSENIWVNVQSSQDCDSLSFDFSRSSDWQPVFQKPLFIPKPVPTENSLYSSPQDVEGLRQMLESKIKSKVQKWRPLMKTIWNRYCGTLLRESLPQWEYWAFNPMEQKPGLGQRLKQLMTTHKIFGFPLNVPFTSAKAVISRVKSTSLHHNDDPNVEFAIGVDLYSYPNNIISVWVYLATITKI